MAAIRDFISPEAREKYQPDYLTEKGRAALDFPIPAHWTPEKAQAAAQIVEEALPRLTVVHAAAQKVRRAGQPPMLPAHADTRAPDRAAMEAENFSRLPLAVRLIGQAGQGAVEMLPSPTERPLIDTGAIPPARGMGERLARAGGGVVAFGAEAALIAMGAGAAGVPAWAASALAGGIPSAAAPGTPKRRVVSGLVMGALSPVAAAVPGVAGIPAGAALFGGVAPLAEHEALQRWGEPTEAPQAEDVMKSMLELGIISAVSHGLPRGPGGPPAGARPAEAPNTPAAPRGPVEAPAASLATPQQRQPIPRIPDEVAPVVFAVAKGNGETGPKGRLDNVKRNPMDGDRTALEGFRERVSKALAADPAADPAKAAARARRQVIGLADLHEKVKVPPGGTAELHAVGKSASDKFTAEMQGKAVTLKGPKPGKEIAGRVEAVFVYPWAPDPFRVAMRDEKTGQLVARAYPSAVAFGEDVVQVHSEAKPAMEPKGGPANVETPERESAPAPQAPAKKQSNSERVSELEVLSERLKGDHSDAGIAAKKAVNVELNARRALEEASPPKNPLAQARIALPPAEAPASRESEALALKIALERDASGVPTARAENAQAKIAGIIFDKTGQMPTPAELKRAMERMAPVAEIKPPRQIAPDEAMIDEYAGASTEDRAALERQYGKEIPEYREARRRSPLPQERIALPPAEIPRTPIAKATKSGAEAVAAMGGEAKPFAEHFADLVKKGEKPEPARAEAEKLSGELAPRGFDAEARAKALLHAAAEEAGQGSLFGAPEPPPAARGEAPAVPERKAEGASTTKGEGWTKAGSSFEPGSIPKFEGNRPILSRFGGWGNVVGRRGETIFVSQAAGSTQRVVEMERAKAEAYTEHVAVGTKHEVKTRALSLDTRKHEDLTGTYTVAERPKLNNFGKMSVVVKSGAGARFEVPLGALGEPGAPTSHVRVEIDTKGKPRTVEVEPGDALQLGQREPATMRAQSLHFHEPFQQRDLTEQQGLIDDEHVQNLLEKHGPGAETLAEAPITVWRDEAGKVGPEGRVYVLSGHHRTHIAQRDWTKLESGRWADTSVSDRDVPVVFHRGDYQSALAKAEVSNLGGKPNTTVEKAGVARRMIDKGASLKDVAVQVTGGKQAAAQDLINLSHLDPEVQRAYFGEKGLPLNVGSYLGAVTKRTGLHSEHQRSWLGMLGSKEIRSFDEFKDVVEGHLRVVEAANQMGLLSKADMGEGAISPRTANAYLGRALKLVGAERREAARASKDTKRLLEKGGSDAEMGAAKVILTRHQRDLARAVKIEKEVQNRALRAIADATAKGEPLANALHRVKEWVDTQMRHGSDEAGFAAVSSGPGGRFLGRLIQRGIERAQRRAAAQPARPEGQRMDGPDFHPAFDDYSDFAATRLWANLRLGNWQDILTPKLGDRYRERAAAEVGLEQHFDDLWEKALGGDRALNYFAEGGSGSKELAKALQKQPHTIPEEFRGAIGRLKQFLDYVHEKEVEHAQRTGQKPPVKRADYGIPHIFLNERSEPLSKLIEQIELRKGKAEMSDQEINDIHNRFFERRTGRPGYVQDATFAIKERVRAAVRKMAWDEFLIDARDHLASPEAATSGLDRANLIRDWTRMRFFREKSAVEQRIDSALRHLLFQNVKGGIRDIGVERAAKALGRDPDALRLEGHENVAWVPPGVEYEKSNTTDLGEFDGGRIVSYPPGEQLMASSSPIARKWVRAMSSFKRGPLVSFGLRGEERSLRHQWKVDRGLDDLSRNPLAVMSGALTGRISTNLFWWNMGFNTINATQTLVTTLPRYGARSYLAAWAGVAKATTRSGVRAALHAYVRTAEKVGWLDAKQAEEARKALPLIVEEVYAEAAGTTQRENLVMQQRAADIADGKNPHMRAMLRGLVTRGDLLNSAIEGMNRTVSILAADHYGARELGLKGLDHRPYENMQAAREDMVKALANPKSREAFAARSTLLDQFAYDPGSFPMAMSGPFGRTAFQLMRWALAATKEAAKQAEGAARVARAAARGARGAEPIAPRRGLPKANGWFEEWLDRNGANWQHRDSAASFVRSVAVSSLLLGATNVTRTAFTNAGIPPHVMLGLWMLRQFFPDDHAIEEWYLQAKEGAMVSTERVPVGPIPQGVVGAATAVNEFQRNRDLHRFAAFPWESVLGTVRLQLLRGEPAIRRIVQENPEWFVDHAPWVFRALGIKAMFPGMTPAQKLKHQTRLMTREERQQQSALAPR